VHGGSPPAQATPLALTYFSEWLQRALRLLFAVVTASLPIVIVGAGAAGTGVAFALRSAGYDGPLLLAGDESHEPYERPPLSKGVLLGTHAPDRCRFRRRALYDERRIELLLGRCATAIDLSERRLRFDDGSETGWRALVLATGSRPRRLAVPGGDDSRIHTLRTLDDSQRIGAALVPGRHLLVVGGGFLGLEIAAAARKRGCRVTVVETATRLLPRLVTAPTSSFFEDLHRAEGVTLLLGRTVRSFEPRETAVRAVLDDGASIDAELCVVAIGADPTDSLARAAGLAVEDGILVDEDGRSSTDGVWAVGDVARRHGAPRLESVPGAAMQARGTAAALLGLPRPATEPPWFWTDQYDVKLTIVGLGRPGDRVVLRGATAARSFAAYHLRQGRVVAVDLVNRPADLARSKQLVATGGRLEEAA
jgi:3-phenylpropionate/trans-cinnamate dioxygenase ferredoxin reductase component